MEWWKDAVFYQIYPRSFQDSNGDGIGDLPGIVSRLDYLRSLGVGAVCLAPIFASPMQDGGFDVSDFRSVDPDYGSMEDLEELIAQCRTRGIRVLLDLPAGCTSAAHRWFRKSRERAAPYADYYLWAPGGKKGSLPNNWTGFYSDDCWEFDPERCEYYLHLFGRSEPELNYRCPAVAEEMLDVQRFWLEKGVAGFRLLAANTLWKESMESGKKRLFLTGAENFLSAEGNHDLLRRFRALWDEYGAFVSGEALFAAPEEAAALSAPGRRELHLALSGEHLTKDWLGVKWIRRPLRPKDLFQCLAKWQAALDWNAVYLEDCGQPRSISRFGGEKYWKESGKLLATLLLTLRGTPLLYQGEELGMLDFDYRRIRQVDDAESRDMERRLRRWHLPRALRWRIVRRASRDNARTPFQWEAGPGAGFTAGRPWLAVNRNRQSVNLAAERADRDSIWHWYRDLIILRSCTEALRRGGFQVLETTERVFAYRRSLGDEALTVALNFSSRPARTACRGSLLRCNYGREDFDGTLRPWEAVILREEPGADGPEKHPSI